MNKTECLAPFYVKKGVFAPCGKCDPCRTLRSREWQFRLYQEYRHAETAYFVTLTYDDETLPTWTDQTTGEIKSNLCKRDIQLFFKRMRKLQTQWEKDQDREHRQIRYYLTGEYGDRTDRAHYHIMLFNIQPELKKKVEELWKKGHAHFGTCNAKTIAYTLKYVLKTDIDRASASQVLNGQKRQNPFSLSSRRPAIGHRYLETHGKYHRSTDTLTCRDINGNKIPLPKYYRERIFGKIQKDRLNSQQLKRMDEKSLERDLKIIRKMQIPEKYYTDQLRAYLRKKEKIKRQKSSRL